MAEYHEPYEELTQETRDFHRALKSLQEELEAADWYSQRIDVCKDPELKQILLHNRNEEIEHAAMVLEWLRRKMLHWDDMLRNYLFTEKSITELEETLESFRPNGHDSDLVRSSNHAEEMSSRNRRSLSIGSLKERLES